MLVSRGKLGTYGNSTFWGLWELYQFSCKPKTTQKMDTGWGGGGGALSRQSTQSEIGEDVPQAPPPSPQAFKAGLIAAGRLI